MSTEIQQLAHEWVSKARDYDLWILARAGVPKKTSLEDPNEVTISVVFRMPEDDDADHVLPFESRIKFFIKRVLAPEVMNWADGDIIKVPLTGPSAVMGTKPVTTLEQLESLLVTSALWTISKPELQKAFNRAVQIVVKEKR